MSSFLNQQLTNIGWDALSMALGGGRLTFYKMQAGSGTIANDAAIPPMIQLVQPVCDIPITKYSIEGDGQITLFGNIASAQLDAGFNFKELGVFATIEAPVTGKGGTPAGPNIEVITAAPDAPISKTNPIVPPPATGTAVMYSYCNSYSNTDYIPGKGESTDVLNTVQVTIKIDKAANVAVSIIAGQQMSVVNIGPPSVGAGPWSYTQANVAYLKRIKPGAATMVVEDANTITIGQKQLNSDLDLYVANGNPDISPNFSTINNAMGYLGQYIIPTSVQARIHVSKGYYYSADTQYIWHPNGQSITVEGPPSNWQWSNSSGIAGSSWNWSMTCYNLADTSQFTAGYYAICWGAGGVTTANHCLVCGFFAIQAVGPNWVRVSIPNYRSSFPIANITSLYIMPINANIVCTTKNQGALITGPGGIRGLNFLGFPCGVTPDTNTWALANVGSATFNYCGVVNWNVQLSNTAQNAVYPLFNAGGNLTCNYCAVSNGQMGIVCGGGNLSLTGCSSSYNSYRSLWACGGGAIGINYTNTYVGASSGGMGVVIANNSVLGIDATYPYPGYLIVQNNDHYGIWIVNQGTVAFSSTICHIWAQVNGLGLGVHYDLVIENLALFASNSLLQGTRICNCPVGQLTAQGGLFN